MNNSDNMLEAIAFAGETLAPFFLEDPETGNAKASFDALAALDASEAAHEWPFADEKEARSALSLMVDALKNGRDGNLTWEYRRLFIGPAALPAPPWGSVYTDRECVIFGDATIKLRVWMREHGIARTNDEKTPEDHIGLMLALMAHLARTQPVCLDDYLQNHFLTWAPHYLAELEKAAEHPFYQGLAQLTRATIEGVQEARALVVALPRFYR